MAKWKCAICGYVYDSEEHDGKPLEEVSNDYQCPLCGENKDQFVLK